MIYDLTGLEIKIKKIVAGDFVKIEYVDAPGNMEIIGVADLIADDGPTEIEGDLAATKKSPRTIAGLIIK